MSIIELHNFVKYVKIHIFVIKDNGIPPQVDIKSYTPTHYFFKKNFALDIIVGDFRIFKLLTIL